ncbi:YfiR family protein [Pantoea phytobeneficialis]|uniref:YfiR family protein n=1 Tax=Pantoea phytobeneficialis TaxID=2052056 RepID=A0AAP9H639_9GAMM|nr:YfiR family protein [Pantoea phytobeneficialis]MDO6409159.1 YfiR family protein [Pantoea phytobeneficialis]QGR07097.1 hypothetical protein CTZ24_11970 [Pantoea phytobeneficialis]
MPIKSEKLRIPSGMHSFMSVITLTRMFIISLPCIFLFILMPSRAVAAQDDAANRIVSGIISFTHWPGLERLPKLCVLPSSQHLSLPSTQTGNGYTVSYLVSENDLLTAQCDAVYFGAQSPQQQAQLLEQISNRPVLAIAETNPECTIGAAFCLIFHQDKTVFSVNLDSLARSGVKVNSEVLLLSRKGSQ